jgi:hypothetical protein
MYKAVNGDVTRASTSTRDANSLHIVPAHTAMTRTYLELLIVVYKAANSGNDGESGSGNSIEHTFCLSATDAVSVRSPIACSTDPSDAASLSALANCCVYDDSHCKQ